MNNLKTQTFDVEAASKAQSDYCNNHRVPHFAPKSGVCYKCRRQIYSPTHIPEQVYDTFTQPAYTKGISVEQAGSTLITGCPYCQYSFCD